MDEARSGGFYDFKSLILICIVIFIISLALLFALFPFYKEYVITENHISNYQEPIFKVMALNGTDYSNSTISINMSHIAEIKENNGTMIIEIRKDPEPIYRESPQKHLIVGDVVSTNKEFWKWKGETTSFTAYVINISDSGSVKLKGVKNPC